MYPDESHMKSQQIGLQKSLVDMAKKDRKVQLLCNTEKDDILKMKKPL